MFLSCGMPNKTTTEIGVAVKYRSNKTSAPTAGSTRLKGQSRHSRGGTVARRGKTNGAKMSATGVGAMSAGQGAFVLL